MKQRKEQWSVWLDAEVRDSLKKRRDNSSYSRSALVNQALRRALFPDADDSAIAPLVRRLDRAARQAERAQEESQRRFGLLEQRMQVMDQRVALFVRYWMTVVMASVSTDDAAVVSGGKRYKQFEERLFQQLTKANDPTEPEVAASWEDR